MYRFSEKNVGINGYLLAIHLVTTPPFRGRSHSPPPRNAPIRSPPARRAWRWARATALHGQPWDPRPWPREFPKDQRLDPPNGRVKFEPVVITQWCFWGPQNDGQLWGGSGYLGWDFVKKNNFDLFCVWSIDGILYGCFFSMEMFGCWCQEVFYLFSGGWMEMLDLSQNFLMLNMRKTSSSWMCCLPFLNPYNLQTPSIQVQTCPLEASKILRCWDTTNNWKENQHEQKNNGHKPSSWCHHHHHQQHHHHQHHHHHHHLIIISLSSSSSSSPSSSHHHLIIIIIIITRLSDSQFTLFESRIQCLRPTPSSGQMKNLSMKGYVVNNHGDGKSPK